MGLAVQELKYASAMPASTNDSTFHEKGEIRINDAPVKGGVWGWQCIAEGTPGTWIELFANNQNSLVTLGAGSTLTEHSRYVSVEAAGALTLGATSLFPKNSPISIRATEASLTITPTGATINGAAAVTLGAAAHVTLLHRGGTLWHSFGS